MPPRHDARPEEHASARGSARPSLPFPSLAGSRSPSEGLGDPPGWQPLAPSRGGPGAAYRKGIQAQLACERAAERCCARMQSVHPVVHRGRAHTAPTPPPSPPTARLRPAGRFAATAPPRPRDRQGRHVTPTSKLWPVR